MITTQTAWHHADLSELHIKSNYIFLFSEVRQVTLRLLKWFLKYTALVLPIPEPFSHKQVAAVPQHVAEGFICFNKD